MQQNVQASKTLSDTAALAIKVAEIEAKLEHLNDRLQISEMFLRYTRGLNRFDLELLEGAFWPDAQVNYGFKSSLRDEWISAWKESYLQRGTSQAHHITNQTMDIDGDVAHVESYLIAFRRANEDKSTIIGGGRYIDRLDRRNGEWRIAVREFIPHFWIEANSIFKTTFTETYWPQTDFGLGTGDKNDLSYRRPLSSRPSKGVGSR